jgi:hypothetical protein
MNAPLSARTSRAPIVTVEPTVGVVGVAEKRSVVGAGIRSR